MRKKAAFTLAACIAWAAAAISSATTASATAVSMVQGGTYATCSGSHTAYAGVACISVSYQQTIQIITTACSSGGGCSPYGTVYTDMVYTTGRKVVSSHYACSPYTVYSLGSCGC